jgi:hypothetical protein
MKSLFAFGLPVVFAVAFAMPAAAQVGASSRALGGEFASRGSSRPLGGITPSFPSPNLNQNRNFRGSNRFGNDRFGSRRRSLGYPFSYSVWVPDYFDNLYDQGPYGASAPQQAEPPDSRQPVIINQYFGAPAPPEAEPRNPPPADPNQNTTTTRAPGDAIGDPQNYYLIAYKNHAVYAALAYWLEDKTLHYVTTQNTHNQASLDLIDLTLTRSLNQDRQVPFTLAGQ